MWLEFPGLCPLHILPDLLDHTHIHRIRDKGTFLDELFYPFMVQSLLNNLVQFISDLWLVSISDSLDQQIAKRMIVKVRLPSTSNT